MSRFFLLATILLSSTGAAASDLVLNNPDFEEVMVGNRIPGWSRTQHAGVRAYEITSDTKSVDKGKASIRMLRTTEQAYGLIMQQLETPDLAGKTVELVAALKGENVGKKGWVMVLTFKNHSNILDQVRAKPVTGDAGWADATITRIAPLGTSHIEIGFMLLDSGAGWADNVRLRTLDVDQPNPEAADADADTEKSVADTVSPDQSESVKAASSKKPATGKGDH
ncbi:hypothetical protein [Dokdonella sp.]|uniref:hypothetical protein n=1 Tax=Dokdonella sp. TaxID=2291710 RepID=UPI003C5DBD58